MLLPIEWLKDFVNIDDIDTRDLVDKLTLSGSNVESINSLNKGIENVVVGKILEIKEHPNADKLVICQVDVGDEIIDLVTGADNMKEEDLVAVAKVGAVLPGDFKIDTTDFRGVDSHGMLCSLEELGYPKELLSDEMKDGILILDKEYKLGTDIIEVLGLDSEVLEIEITPNRPDSLSVIGLARETAAALKKDINIPEIKISETEDKIEDYISKINVDTKNCNRYYARVIKDVKIEESPLWLQLRLIESGMRPVNNIVDIANYVMLEQGEPLHTFDLDKINGDEIIVRQAENGEKIKTLDEEDRELDENDIVIADEKGPIAIAGVMGSLDTEITNETTTVLLEGANFDEKSVRLTARKLNLRSEASNRFEKGIDTELSQTAVDRVCELVEEIGAGKVVGSFIDVYDKKDEEREVSVQAELVNRRLGIYIGISEMLEHLNSLGLESREEDGVITSIIPTYRKDIKRDVDLVEEIGRLYGFHNIEPKPLVGVLEPGKKPYSRKVEEKVQDVLLSFGFNEVLTYSFISPKGYDAIKISEDSELREYIELINPLGLDYSVMRTTLIPTMMELLSRNYNRGIESAYAFEIGNTFFPKELPVVNEPIEKKVLSIGFYGEEDFFYLKEAIDEVFNRLGINGVKYIRETNNPTFHPGRCASIELDGKDIGVLGEIHPDVLENYGISERVYLAHIDFETLIEATKFDKSFVPLPKYPAINRDIAVVVDEDILVGELEEIILEHGKGLVEEIELFDIYTGDQIEEGKKSVALSIRYRSNKGTMKDKIVNDIQENIIKDIEKKLDGKLRS